MTAVVAGRLYLVPVPLDFGLAAHALTDTLPQATLECAARLDTWICENAKTLRAFLKRVDAVVPLHKPLQDITIHELPAALRKARRGPAAGADPILRAWLRQARGRDVGLASEAGMPAVADAGREVVAAAQDEGFSIQPLVGPVSLMLALAASGLDGQSFAFAGYAPSDAALRTTFLRQLERTALASGQTQILIETPYRNASLFEALMVTLAASTRLCVASGLTTVDAHVATKKIASWRSTASAAGSRDLKTQLEAPCVFVIGP